MSADTRTRLEKAADLNGQSIAKEADDRLRQSLLDDVQLGGGDTARVFRTLAGVVWTIERALGKKWVEDEQTAIAVKAAIVQSVDTIIRTAAFDKIGQLAAMDELDLQEQELDAEALELVRERARQHDEASDFGQSIALGALRERKIDRGGH